MPAPCRHPWKEIERRFLAGEDVRDLAAAYGTSRGTILNRSSIYCWEAKATLNRNPDVLARRRQRRAEFRDIRASFQGEG